MLPREPVKRILFVEGTVSDFLLHRMALAGKLLEIGFEVHAALPRELGLKYISRQGVRVHIIHIQRKSTRPLDELRCLVSLVRLYRSLRPILVHHIGVKCVLHGGIVARLTRVPAVVDTFTGLGYLFTTDTVKTRLLRAIVVGGFRFSFAHKNHRVIFQNPDDRNWVRTMSNIPEDCAVLIKGSGINPSLFTPVPEPEEPVIIMASRLLWAKGVGDFVTAARTLRASGIRARFVLLGEPDPDHPSAVPLQVLEHWRDAGDVEWLGWQHDMPAVLGQSQIICLPSYYGEGVPRVLIEAAACGRPIVATDTPGCREVVRHGENGLLVPPRDAERLAGALARLIENPLLRATMGHRSREIALTEFSLAQVIDDNLDTYRSLLVGPQKPWYSLPAMMP